MKTVNFFGHNCFITLFCGFVNFMVEKVALCRQLLGTAVDTEPPLELACKKAYTRIGFYKGMVVALKPIYKRSIDLTRNIRKELIQVNLSYTNNINTLVHATLLSLVCQLHG